jgi:hypothetical protein
MSDLLKFLVIKSESCILDLMGVQEVRWDKGGIETTDGMERGMINMKLRDTIPFIRELNQHLKE